MANTPQRKIALNPQPSPETPAVLPPTPSIKAINGHGWATSIQVAEYFGKRHKDVLRSYRDICSDDDFSRRNFAPRDYVDPRGQTQPMVEMTKDGFMLLVMGFTGPRALEWKKTFINAFNEMERRLRALEVNPSAFDLQALPRVSNKQMEQARKKSNELLRDVLMAKTMEEKRQHYRFLVRSNSSVGIDTDSMEALGIERPKLQIEGGAA